MSAQFHPVSGMDRTASRTMVPPILLPQNRHPHRRWRGRCAALDPVRSIPGGAFRLSHDGGNHDSRTAYRGTARRASRHHRSGRTSPNRSRVASGAFESCGTGSDNRSMAGLIVRYEGGGGIAGRRLWPSGWLRRAELRGFGHFEGEGRGSARLKLGLSSEPKLLSAHRFFTRQVAGAARQGTAKPLISRASKRDSSMCSWLLVQPSHSTTISASREPLR